MEEGSWPQRSYSRRLQKFCFWMAVLAGAFAWYSGTKSEVLPAPAALLDELSSEPEQHPSSASPFMFSYMGTDYEVVPVAEYELWGLVVTHNDINQFSDIYHDSGSVDLRDICVLWGENLETTAYQRWKFWSEPWSCHMRTDNGADFQMFSNSAIGNNHLLSSSAFVREQILKARRGDQIYMRGKLVNYRRARSADPWRKSSVSRDDEGNGACEVVFVDEFSIERPANTSWRSRARSARALAVISALLCILCFLFDVYVQPRAA